MIGDSSIDRLHSRVSGLKRWREMGDRYVTFEELLKEREEKGIAIGEVKGLSAEIYCIEEFRKAADI